MIFDERAKNWDTERRIKRAKLITDVMREYMTKTKYKSGMDFGCGTGLIGFNLCDMFECMDMIDLSKGMIEQVEEKKRTYELDHVNPRCLDIFEDPEEEVYDVIVTSMVLHHMVPIENVLKVFYRLLKNEGELVFVDLDPVGPEFHTRELNFDGYNGFVQKELVEVLEQVGFNVMKNETFFEGIKNYDDVVNVPYSLFIMKAVKE